MPQTYKLEQFTNGWLPGVDPINGPKTGLLAMESVELDQTGALIMSGGVSNLNASFNYPANAHTLYSKFISGVLKSYQALTDGSIFRDTTSIGTGGSATRAAFGSAFNYVFYFSGARRRRDDGTLTSAVGLQPPSSITVALGAAGVLTGDYQYAQQNVANFGNSYIVKSPLTLATPNPISPSAQQVTVTIEDPTSSGGPFANEVWIFRRGGDLSQWTRVYRQTAGPWNAFNDNVADIDAIAGGEFANEFLRDVSVNNIPEDILEMAGLVNGRMIFFSAKNIYFSEINSPDTYDTRTSIGLGGNQNTGAEFFLFAKKIGENVVLVATTADMYILTGTFTSNPDGTLDIYLRSLGVENPPISISYAVYNDTIIYMAADGWRQLSPLSGQVKSLVPPVLDRQYRGETISNYGGTPIFLYPAVDAGGRLIQYWCAAARNKLWTLTPHIVNNDPTQPYVYYLQVYDFVRNYWRVLPNINPRIIHTREDDAVVGWFDDTAKNLRIIDDQFTKLNMGVKQNVHVKTLFLDMEMPRQRKDIWTIKFLIDTGGDNITVNFLYNDGVGTIGFTTVNSNGYSEVAYAIGLPFKNFQLEFIGQCANFKLSQIVIEYDPRPIQQLIYQLLRQTFQIGDSNRKRVRTWPIVIDTLGANVNITPAVDGVAGTLVAFNTNFKKTILYQFDIDAFGTDYALLFQATTNTPFEIWEIKEPDNVQILPLAKRFWQSGPIELFGTGIIRMLAIRCVSFNSILATIPWNLYLGDTSVATGSFTPTMSKDDTYYSQVPRFDGNNSGRIFRLELGPVTFDFCPYYVRAQIIRSGAQKDTENEWINLNGD